MKLPDIPELHTERLTLRMLQAGDDEAIFRMHNEASVRKYTQRSKPKGIEDARDFIRTISKGVRNKEWLYWAITEKGKDTLIGTICLWNFSKEENKAETGFELHPDFQSKGIMQEALACVIRYGFHTLGLDRILALTHEENERSIRLLERNGFVRKKMIQEEHALTGEAVNMLVYVNELR